MTSRTLRDGTIVIGELEHVTRAMEIDRNMAAEVREWIAKLRAAGVKAAHPDDGWVDREADTVHLCYPQFNDGLGVGDLLALGGPERSRIVRVYGTSENRLAPAADQPWRFHFTAEP